MRDKENRKGIIYCAYNKLNGKRYIGQTVQRLCERRCAHYGKVSAPYFHHALLKYKYEDWEWKIIDSGIGQKELNDKETFWISFFDTTNPNKGYNLRAGGQDGHQTVEEIKHARERFMEEHGKDRRNTERQPRKSIKCVETGEVFKTISLAEKQYKIKSGEIGKVLCGLRETAKGYHWEYSDDLSCFEDAYGCIELKTVYTTWKQATIEDGFHGGKLKARLVASSPCHYAGYTFYWLNPQYHSGTHS